MMKMVTLRRIKNLWTDCPQILDANDEKFCLAVFPDAYDASKSEDGLQKNKSVSMLSLGDSTLRGLMKDNRKSYGSDKVAFIAAGFTNHLKKHLANDASFRFKSGGTMSYRKSMLDKICVLVENTSPTMTAEHAIFNELSVVMLWKEKCEDSDALKGAIDELLKINTKDTIVYALFLYILAAVYGDCMGELSALYSAEAIQQVYEKSDMLDRIYTRKHIPLGEEDVTHDYVENYHVYLFRRTKDWIYDNARLKIETGNNGKYIATLILADSNTAPNISGDTARPIKRIFKGTPILSVEDESVYIIFREESTEKFAILSFRYQKFTTGKMYYRTGLLMLADQDLTKRHYPMVQKVCICKNKADEVQLACIRGMLSTTCSQIVMTETQLDQFKEEIAKLNVPWKDAFLDVYVKFIEMHVKRIKVYVFDENEILTSTFGDMSEEDRMQIMLMLKAKAAPSKGNSYNFVSSGEHIDFHKLVKEN